MIMDEDQIVARYASTGNTYIPRPSLAQSLT
jgi:hypothetical protein